MTTSTPQNQTEQTLLSLGLEEHEVKTYLALLDLGESTATALSQRTGLGRVHMYQITERLIHKGIASYIIKNNVKFFKAADPETLLKKLQEKEENLKSILPELKARQQLAKPETKVETYRGRKGVNTIFRMILKESADYYILGGANEACSIFELENTIFVKRAEKQGMKGKILARKDDSFFIAKNEEFRYVPDHMISSTTQMIFGEKTAIFVWSEPYFVILIDNKEVTEGNLATFNYMWDTAEKASEKDRKKRLM
ncbi:hypothetical protein KY362_01840 [Candidatus Woesearchaeota archaeon]|nr:hypothetical protein [Candidatus Woesearchaeota archaeon]